MNQMDFGGYIPVSPSPEEYFRKEEGKAIFRRGMGIGFGLIGMVLVSQLLLTALLPVFTLLGLTSQTGSADFWYMQPELYYVVYSLLYLAMVVLPFAVLIPIFHLRRESVLPLRRVTDAKCTAALVAIGLGTCMVSNFMTNSYADLLENGFGIVTSFPESDIGDTALLKLMYVITIAVLPPLAEEFAFRGVVLGMLRPYGEGIAVFGSAFVFGLMHGNLVQIPFAFVCGLIFGYVVVKTGSILPSVLLHFLNNGLSVLQELLPQTAGAAALSYLLYFAALAAAVVGMVVLLKKDSGAFALAQPVHSRLTEKQRFTHFVGNPGMILAFVVIAAEIAMTVQLQPVW